MDGHQDEVMDTYRSSPNFENVRDFAPPRVLQIIPQTKKELPARGVVLSIPVTEPSLMCRRPLRESLTTSYRHTHQLPS